MDLIVTGTNRYAAQKLNAGTVSNNGGLKAWKEINVKKMYVFLELSFVRYWWKFQTLTNTGQKINRIEIYISSRMTRDRYSGIHLVKKLKERKALHCGTLRSNKKELLKDFISNKIKKVGW